MQPQDTKRVVLIAVILGALVISIVTLVVLITPQKQVPEPVVEIPKPEFSTETIGKSVEGRAIEAYTYGSGEKHLLFVGGMHGGYEWNSVLLAYTFIDYLDEGMESIPPGLTITVIPSINPDGVFKVTGKEGRFKATDVSSNTATVTAGRFNTHTVDLNRNFDCKWKPESTWQNRTVSAGTAPFSEPEALALRDFVLKSTPDAVIFWHSKSNAVYASECEKGILPGTVSAMNAYAKASGYKAVESFDAYPITGDAEGWLASISIPAITVELQTHETVEWERNLAGIKALFNLYGSETN